MSQHVEFKSLGIKAEKHQQEYLLKVTGALYLNEALQYIQLVKAVPQGANPRELLLEIQYGHKTAEVRKVYNPFAYSEAMPERDTYVSVRLIYDGWLSESFGVDIDPQTEKASG